MAGTKEYNAFINVTKDGRPYVLNRGGRFPVDETEVFTSLEKLNEYLKDSTNVYPGQIVAVADDRTDGTSTADRSEQGIYYINNKSSKTDEYVAEKIALLSDIEGGVSTVVKNLNDYQITPLVNLANSLYGDDTTNEGKIWETVAILPASDASTNTAILTANDIVNKQKNDSELYSIEPVQ